MLQAYASSCFGQKSIQILLVQVHFGHFEGSRRFEVNVLAKVDTGKTTLSYEVK